MEGYKDRYTAISDYVTETEPTFRSDILSSIPVADLLIAPIEDLPHIGADDEKRYCYEI